MPTIHPTALVDPKAIVGEGTYIGPYCTVGPDVVIGKNNTFKSHVVVTGITTIGEDNTFYQFSSIGEANQDKKYKGEPTRTQIGNGNQVRESVTIHRGTVQDDGLTRIGNNNLLMATSHVGHDVKMGSNTIIANSVALAGHVHLDDYAIVGGLTGVHQFCKIGQHAMIGGCSAVRQDVPAFVMAEGNPLKPRILNFEGMKRRGFSKEAMGALKKCYRLLYVRGIKLEEAVQEIKILVDEAPEVQIFLDSIERAHRGIIR